MSTLDGASLSGAAALPALSATRSGTLSTRGNTDQAVREQATEPATETVSFALGYEYARLAIGESNRQVEQAEQLQEEREERYSAEKRAERQEALKKAGEEQIRGKDEEPDLAQDAEIERPAPSLVSQPGNEVQSSGVVQGLSNSEPAAAQVREQGEEQEQPAAELHIDVVA